MPSIADQLIGQALSESGKSRADIGGSLQQGAQLATNIENLQRQREQLEMQKQEHEIAKINSVVDTFRMANESKDPKMKRFLLDKVAPSKITALGLDKFFPPHTMEMIASSDEAQKKVLGLQLDLDQKVRSGELTGLQAYQIAQQTLSDPEELAMLPTDQLFEAQKFAASEEGKAYRTKLQGQIAAGKENIKTGQVGQQELAKQVAKSFSEYTTGGGKSGMESAIAGLDRAAKALESGVVVTGGISTKIPGFKTDDAQAMLNPKLIEIKSDAQAALNTVLRATLGPQFTEKEGERVLNQVWNDKLSPAANAKKVRNKINELRANIKNAEAQFIRFGYMPAAAQSFGSEDPQIAKFAADNKISYEQAVQLIEARKKKAGKK